MSIQWTFIAGYLYAEIAAVIILMLPIASPRAWHKFFKSRLFTTIGKHTATYFWILFGILSLFLMDSIKEMHKYSASKEVSHPDVASELKLGIKLFRAQRNFYITGFAVFLSFVIRRWVAMILIQAELFERTAFIVKETVAIKNHAKEAIVAQCIEKKEVSKDYDEVKAKLEQTQELLELERKKLAEVTKDYEDYQKTHKAAVRARLEMGDKD